MRYRLLESLRRSTAPDRRGLTWWDLSELGLVALGFLLYFLVRGGVVDRTQDALRNARWIVDVEHAMGIFVEPEVNQWALDSAPLRELVNFVYFWMDFPLIIAVGLFFFWWQRRWYTVLRDALLSSGGIALVMYWSIPVAPPRFLKEWGFVDTLEAYSELSYQAQSLQPFVNPYAAVPSLHVGWSMLLMVVVFGATRNVWWRAAGVLTFVLQYFAVVATANHYILDGVAGLLVCAVGLGIAVWLQRVGYPWVHRRVSALAQEAEAAHGGGASV